RSGWGRRRWTTCTGWRSPLSGSSAGPPDDRVGHGQAAVAEVGAGEVDDVVADCSQRVHGPEGEHLAHRPRHRRAPIDDLEVEDGQEVAHRLLLEPAEVRAGLEHREDGSEGRDEVELTPVEDGRHRGCAALPIALASGV